MRIWDHKNKNFQTCLIVSDISQNLHHLHPGGPGLVGWHNDLVNVKIDNIFINVHVLEKTVIDGDLFSPPFLILIPPIRLIQKHVG